MYWMNFDILKLVPKSYTHIYIPSAHDAPFCKWFWSGLNKFLFRPHRVFGALGHDESEIIDWKKCTPPGGKHVSLSKDEPPIQSHPKIYHISKPPKKKIMGNVQEKVASCIFSKGFLFFSPPPKKKTKKCSKPSKNIQLPTHHFRRGPRSISSGSKPTHRLHGAHMATWGAAEAVLKQASLGRSVTGIRSQKKHLNVLGVFCLEGCFCSLVGRCFFGWKFPEKF